MTQKASPAAEDRSSAPMAAARLALIVVGIGLGYAALRALAAWHGNRIAPAVVPMNWRADLVGTCVVVLLLPLPVLWARRQAGRRKRPWFWLRWIACVAVFAALHRLVLVLNHTFLGIGPDNPYGLTGFLRSWLWLTFIDSYTVGSAAGVSYLLASDSLAAARRRETLELRAELGIERARLLRARLDPHFLFNTLNAAGSLLPAHPEGASRVLSGLRDLLDASSREHRDLLPLERELGIVETYLRIERERFGDRLAVVYEIEAATCRAAVPPLLLQPLVENAVRHGLARPGGGHVWLRARRQGRWLELEIEDDGDGRLAVPRTDREARRRRGGFGLAATRARLAALFGGEHSFSIIFRPNRGTLLRLSLPFSEVPP